CASCHVPASGFLDSRSPRRQISLAAGWTRRRAPSLLNVAQAKLLFWDGRRDAAYAAPFTPIEDPLEFNSSRLYAAQQRARLSRDACEALFGPMPSLDAYAPLAAAEAGCNALPIYASEPHGSCDKEGKTDDAVTEIVVNMGKAIEAYLRGITCGQG